MIRQAKLEDYLGIKAIKASLAYDLSRLTDSDYKSEIEKVGFLIPGKYTKKEHNDDLKKIFLVYEENGKVLGYIRIDETQEMKETDNAKWLLPLEDLYFSLPHANIGGVAVLPNTEKHGIGTELLETAEQKLKEKGVQHLFSFVIMSPITNTPSKNFHEKNGFQKAAEARAEKMFGLRNFQSALYYKKLS